MALYNEFETKTSYKYLKEIVNILNEPICILGGWAVYLTVNNNFRESEGRNYLGSRDIDLGFHIDKDVTRKQLDDTTISKSLKLIEKEGFKPQGFRYYKEVNYETGNEITSEEIKTMPTHNIFTIFIDPIVDYIHPSFQKILKFHPVDEPLLSIVFKNDKHRRELKQFNKLLWLPSPEILLATKMKSASNRTKDEKLVKDICDIYALSWYSGKNLQEIKNRSLKHINQKFLTKFKEMLKSEKEAIKKAEIAMDIDAETIENLIHELLS